MDALTLTLMAGLYAAPILVFGICVYVCIRRRNFLGGAGSLACFLLLLSISYPVQEHCSSPYQYIVNGLLGTGYLWLFFVRPFIGGLKGDK
jgi:ABC-type sulfate transport system permease subunit